MDRAPASFASLCLLSYNRPVFVEQAIRTATMNAEFPVELLVHDDGSDEETLIVLRKLMDEGLISTLLTNHRGHNQGQGTALNRMFQMAKGDPIVKLDHDLIFYPGWLRAAIGILDGNRVDPAEPQIGAMGLFKYHADPVHHEKMFIRGFPGWEQHKDFVGSAMVIPRAVWEQLGPFDEGSEAFAEDYSFKMKVHDSGFVNALPAETLADNQGFGLGPSTVVVQKPNGDLTSRAIHKLPWVIE